MKIGIYFNVNGLRDYMQVEDYDEIKRHSQPSLLFCLFTWGN